MEKGKKKKNTDVNDTTMRKTTEDEKMKRTQGETEKCTNWVLTMKNRWMKKLEKMLKSDLYFKSKVLVSDYFRRSSYTL